MPGTGIVRDPLFLAHGVRDEHPENRRRLAAVYDLLAQPTRRGCFVDIAARAARTQDILSVHSAAYVDRVAATEGREFTQLTPDTHASADTFRAALAAVGGLFEAVTRVIGGDLANAFALTRPPGHHAERSRAMGYCIFNNVALAARYARNTLGLSRVLIVDWDVHHGNGTQHAFENDPSVLFFSLHQHPHFPGTGLFTECGRGAGEGYTVNLPLSKGHGDAEYAAIFETLLQPVALEFEPELILVSAGFDTHLADPMGNMRMTEAGFAVLTRCLMHLADRCCRGRVVLCLEGGYDIEATAASVMAVLDELAGRSMSDPAPLSAQARTRKLAPAVKRFRHVQKRFWKSLA
jgi:acetoin utilization deacetylase AcuC-like enzyme